MEVLARYSKIPQPPKLGQLTPRPAAPTARRTHNATKRLGTDAIQQLVADYETGLSTTALMTKYNLGKGTVLRLLRTSGVTIRHQSLNKDEIQQVTDRYQRGDSLATIGRHFGRDASLIRRVLQQAGIPRRDTHGRVR